MTAPKLLGVRFCAFNKKGNASYKDWEDNLQEERCDRPPFILLRGLGRSSVFWMDFPKKLAQHSDVFMIDLWGTGKSRSSFGHGKIQNFAQDLWHTLNHYKLLPCNLIGISLGGMVALETSKFAVAQQGLSNSSDILTQTVIASSARELGTTRIFPQALVRILSAFFFHKIRHQNFARFLVSEGFLQLHQHLPEKWNQMWNSENIKKIPVFRQLMAAAQFRSRKFLPTIRIPTLYIVSKDDRLVHWLNSERLWEQTPQAELIVTQKVGHDIPTEIPDELSEWIIKFCERSINPNLEMR